MFEGLGGAYLSEASFIYSTLGCAPGLTHKHNTKHAKGKRASLLRKFVNYGRKKFYSFGRRFLTFSFSEFKEDDDEIKFGIFPELMVSTEATAI